MIDYSLVPMSAEHIGQICEIENACFSDPWSAQSFEESIASEYISYYVILSDGIVAGYIGAAAVLDEAEIVNVAVSPRFRRQGIGRTLIAALIEKYKAKGVGRFDLEVRESNIAARSLYESLGFEYCGRRPRFYSHPAEDALLMFRDK